MFRYKNHSIVVLLFLMSINVFSQGCAMCKAAVEKGEKESFNDAIIYLMMFPYIIGAFAIALFIYLLKKKKLQQES